MSENGINIKSGSGYLTAQACLEDREKRKRKRLIQRRKFGK